MTIRHGLRLLALIALLVACSDSADTVSYTVQVTSIEVVPKGGDQQLAVDGLPSTFGTLVQPNPGRYRRPAP